MKFKVNDKVIFKHISNKIYAWVLNNGETYTISNAAFDKTGEMFYGVTNINGNTSTWYLEKDFVSLKKSRIDKLKKIRFINLVNQKVR